jgi:peptide/nickel transport system permease protein
MPLPGDGQPLTRRMLGLRVVRLIITFLLVTFLTSLLLLLAPGDPAYFIAGPDAPPEVIDAVRSQYRLDAPVLSRYVQWLGDFSQGDFGDSHFNRVPVADSIRQRIPVTLELAVLAMLLSLAVAVPLAVVCAQRAGSGLDRFANGVTSAFISAPGFVVALLLVYFLALRWQLFPVIGWTPLTKDVSDNLRGAVLPVLAISLGPMVAMFRVLRSDLMATLQQDYIALARSKGLSPRRIMWFHALKPSSFSLITLSGISFAGLMGGTVLIESIFVLPGLGQFVLQSINAKDLAAVQGAVAFIALVFLVVNFTVDMLYGVLDPRTRTAA